MKKMFQKAINIAVARGIIKPVTPKLKPKTEKKTTTNKTKTYTTKKKTSILNQINLLNKTSTTKKKTLLGE